MSGEIIIIEGCDKAGKTTFATALAEALGWGVVKCGQPRITPPVDEYLGHALQRGEPFIADRFHLGQLVYGPVYRGELDNRFRFRLLELLLLARGAVLVYLYQAPEVLRERFKRDGERFAKEDDIGRLLVLYDRAYRWSCLPKTSPYVVDKSHSLASTVDQVVKLVQQQKPLPHDAWSRREVVGSLKARALLVGDERNWTDRVEEEWRRVPFYSVAGDYLLHALDNAGLVNEALLTNSRSTTKEVLDVGLLFRLVNQRLEAGLRESSLPVVALGQAAESRLRKAGVPIAATVPHPQWWRRFHHHDLVGYRDALQSAVLEGKSWAG